MNETHDPRNRVQESQQLSSDPGSAYMKEDSVAGGNGPITSYSYKHGGDRASVTDADSHTTVTIRLWRTTSDTKLKTRMFKTSFWISIV